MLGWRKNKEPKKEAAAPNANPTVPAVHGLPAADDAPPEILARWRRGETATPAKSATAVTADHVDVRLKDGNGWTLYYAHLVGVEDRRSEVVGHFSRYMLKIVGRNLSSVYQGLAERTLARVAELTDAEAAGLPETAVATTAVSVTPV